MRKIHIFKAGEQISSTGFKKNFTEGDLQSMVDSFDPNTHEPPIRVGHEDNDKVPAFGWVKNLEKQGENLYAYVQFTPEMEDMIKKGNYRKVSASFYSPASEVNPKKGNYTLKHVAMLGGTPPAVKGLEPFGFSENDDELLSMELEITFMEQNLLENLQDVTAEYLEALNSDSYSEGGGCPEGEKMVFGVCRKVGSSDKSESEKKLEEKAGQQKSDVKNNKKVVIDGKEYGWAVKDGKPILVAWGSVAGKDKKKSTSTPTPKETPKKATETKKSQELTGNPSGEKTGRQEGGKTITSEAAQEARKKSLELAGKPSSRNPRQKDYSEMIKEKMELEEFKQKVEIEIGDEKGEEEEEMEMSSKNAKHSMKKDSSYEEEAPMDEDEEVLEDQEKEMKSKKVEMSDCGSSDKKKKKMSYSETDEEVLKARLEEMEAKFSELSAKEEEAKELKQRLEKMEQQFAEMEAAKAEAEALLAEEKRERRRETLSQKVEALYSEGQMTEGIFPQEELFDFAVGLEEGTLEFSEGESAADKLVEILSRIPSPVNFSEVAPEAEAPEKEEKVEMDFSEKVEKYAIENGISFEEALRILAD